MNIYIYIYIICYPYSCVIRKFDDDVVEVLDDDSQVEGCFKNKKIFIEELSSAQTILFAHTFEVFS